jgi:hypothetical protein
MAKTTDCWLLDNATRKLWPEQNFQRSGPEVLVAASGAPLKSPLIRLLLVDGRLKYSIKTYWDLLDPTGFDSFGFPDNTGATMR